MFLQLFSFWHTDLSITDYDTLYPFHHLADADKQDLCHEDSHEPVTDEFNQTSSTEKQGRQWL